MGASAAAGTRWLTTTCTMSSSGTAARSPAAACSDTARRRRAGRDHAGTGAMAVRFRPGQAVKIGTLQPLSGAAAAGGNTALIGTQMAVDRTNKSGGINGRPVELIVADYESKPDVGRRKAEKLLVEDRIDAHQGGFLSNVCLACMPVFEEHKVVNMIGACLTPRSPPGSAAASPSGHSTTHRRRRWRSHPRSSSWARSGTLPMPIMLGASPPATPTSSRSRRTAAW